MSDFSTTYLASGPASSIVGGDSGPKLNLWSAEIEAPTDEDVEPGLCCASQSEPAGMTDNGLIKEDHNGPLLPNLHANGKVDLRDVCPSQPYDRNEDIATEDKEEADTEKRTCFWATQDDPAVNTLQTLPVVNRDLNLAISNDRGTGNTSLTLVEDRRDQKLGLDTKGPFPKGGAAENVKVYARRKEGVKGKYKAQTNLEPTLGAIREEGEISISDPGDISAAHCEVGAQPEPAIATLDTILFQPQFSPTLPCKSNKKNKEAQEGRDLHISDSEGLTPEQQYPSHSPAPNSGFSKVFSENEEALHMAIARDLGVSYAKTNNSKDNVMNEDNISRCFNELAGLMGMKQIEP